MSIARTISGVLVLAAVALSPTATRAQLRPLRTEDPQPIASGHVLIELGVDYEVNQAYPASGLEGNQLRLPALAFRVGLGPIAEFQLAGGLNILRVDHRQSAPLSNKVDFSGSTTTEVEDPVVGMKIRLRKEAERVPAIGFQFSTRLPAAGNESGLGLDTTDFMFGLLIGKTIGQTRLAGNFGLGILSVPTQGDIQNDVLLYGISVATRINRRVSLVGEISGRIDAAGSTPPGTEDQGQFRLGARYKLGPVVFDGAGLLGMHRHDPDWGVTLGVSYLFKAFDAQ